jgi:protein phosphatase
MRIDYAAATDAGLVRRRNEDAFIADADLGLFVVIDGMGGHVSGEVASQMVADGVRDFIRDTAADPDKTWPVGFDAQLSKDANRLQMAILHANGRLAEAVRADSSLGGTGATISATLFTARHVIVSNVGDCRVYLARDRTSWQVTRDHSLVGEQLSMGLLDSEEARHHPLRHVITRAISGNRAMSVDTWELNVQPGDRILLCSDGVHGELTDSELTALVTRNDCTLETLCKDVVRAANHKGGSDNSTVVVIEVKELDDGSHVAAPPTTNAQRQ